MLKPHFQTSSSNVYVIPLIFHKCIVVSSHLSMDVYVNMYNLGILRMCANL